MDITLPWWGSVSFVCGGFLVGTFLPNLVPKKWHNAAVGVGVLLCAIGVISGLPQLARFGFNTGPLVALAVALLIGGSAVGWQIHLWQESPTPTRQQPPPTKETSVLAECNFGTLPTKPPDGRIYVLNLYPTPIGGGGLAEYFGLKEAHFTWPEQENGAPLSAYRCRLTNYGNDTLFKLTFGFRLVFNRAIATPPSIQSGEIFLDREWPVEVTKIDPGADRSFEFYIWNMSNAFVSVTILPNATARKVSDGSQIPIRLLSRGYMMFSPATAPSTKADRTNQ